MLGTMLFEFGQNSPPRKVQDAPKELLRWTGSRANWLLAALCSAIAFAYLTSSIVNGVWPLPLFLIGHLLVRGNHRSKTRTLLVNGIVCVGTTEQATKPLTERGFGFRYMAPNGWRYEAAVQCGEYALFVASDAAPVRVDLLLNADDFRSGSAHIPGAGLVSFVASRMRQGAPLREAQHSLEPRLRPVFAWDITGKVVKAIVCGSLVLIYVAVITASVVGGILGVLHIVFEIGSRNTPNGVFVAMSGGAMVLGVVANAIFQWGGRLWQSAAASGGEDGVCLGERFIPFERIAAIQPKVLGLETGELLKFSGDSQVLRQLHRDFTSLEGARLPPAASQRGRSVVAWLKRLQTMLRSQGRQGYRENALSEDDLWLVAESARGTLVERAAAAATLATLGEKSRFRIMNLAARTARPRLRRLFEQSAAQEEELAAEIESLSEDAADADTRV